MARPVETDQEELDVLLHVLPEDLRGAVSRLPQDALLEIVLDLGRIPQARMVNGVEPLADTELTAEQLAATVARIGRFNEDNRAGIERTLHRLSAIRNREGAVVGLTLRVGRSMRGSVDVLRDLLQDGLNVLLLGRPGVGKTTLLRAVARLLADEMGRRVMVVDTSNEIGGDGDIPHRAIGSARRMQVQRPDLQHAVMIEAVENHMPEAIIVDEIGTEAEAHAARTIAERGVQLVGTAHGNTLENLVLNPTLSDLIGGVHTVTLSDEEAHRRRTQKTVRERRAPPTFDAVVEMLARDEVVVHRSTADAVDRLLTGEAARGETRRIGEGGAMEVHDAEVAGPIPFPAETVPHDVLSGVPRKIFPLGLRKEIVERQLDELGLKARVVDRPSRADLLLVARAHAGEPLVKRLAEGGMPVHVVRHASSAQVRRALERIFAVVRGADDDETREAVQEAEHAIQRALAENVEVALAPRPPALRRVQHRMVSRHHLDAESVGREPSRHLLIHPPHSDA